MLSRRMRAAVAAMFGAAACLSEVGLGANMVTFKDVYGVGKNCSPEQKKCVEVMKNALGTKPKPFQAFDGAYIVLLNCMSKAKKTDSTSSCTVGYSGTITVDSPLECPDLTLTGPASMAGIGVRVKQVRFERALPCLKGRKTVDGVIDAALGAVPGHCTPSSAPANLKFVVKGDGNKLELPPLEKGKKNATPGAAGGDNINGLPSTVLGCPPVKYTLEFSQAKPNLALSALLLALPATLLAALAF